MKQGQRVLARSHRFGARCALVAVVLATLGAAVSPASAAPTNDNFAAAQAMSGVPASAAGTNVEATKEPGEPNHAGNQGAHSVWYRWTAPESGTVLIDTCARTVRDFDTLLAVYTGNAVGALTAVASDDDGCGGLGSRLSLTATAGTTYFIAVDGFAYDDNDPGASGTFMLSLGPMSTRPPNDDFAEAAELFESDGSSAYGWNTHATKEPDEPDHAGNVGGHSVWYRWTAPMSGPVSLDTCGSDFDTLLAVYTGAAVGSLTAVASNDNGLDCGPDSQVEFTATAGTTYRFAVDGKDGASGSVLELSLITPPSNDNFGDAETLHGSRDSAFGRNTYATKEPGEPEHGGNAGGHSVWYHWTAPSSGTVAVSTCGSNFDTLLAVYTGVAVGSLTPVASSDDSLACGTAGQLSFVATAGTNYLVAVDGKNGALGKTVELAIDDVEAPETTIDSGPSGATADTTPTFSFSSSESATFECRFDSAAFGACSGPGAAHTAGTALAPGAHTFDTRATDAAGNTDVTPARRAFTISPPAEPDPVEPEPVHPSPVAPEPVDAGPVEPAPAHSDDEGLPDPGDRCPATAGATSDGCPGGAVPDRSAPRLSDLSLRGRPFEATKRGPSIVRRGGVVVSYELSEPATLRFLVDRQIRGRKLGGECKRASRMNRGRRPCKIYRFVSGAFTHTGAAGASSFRFSGWVGGRRLGAGRYRLGATPVDAAGNAGRSGYSAFSVR